MKRSVDVIIPAYQPGKNFGELLRRLQRQSRPPEKILVMNTEKEYWDRADFDKTPFENGEENGVVYQVEHLSREDFDHGGTRAAAAKKCRGEVLLFMTQDAMPENDRLIEELLKMMEESGAAAVYARQLPAEDCCLIERYTRSFNYGETSRIKSRKDLPELGIKTYFCSNVCAAYDRKTYESMGGFPQKTIFNEDMIFAAGLIGAGYKIAYAAEARVVHSHNYSAMQQFHRNFDLAVSQAQYPEIFSGVSSEGEGIRLVKKTAGYLCREKKHALLPELVWQSGWKYLGYLMGKRYRRLPFWLVKRCSMNKNYWKDKNF